MNSWFIIKVKYTKQLDDGTFKRVSEPYMVAAMTFSEGEERIYEELGALIRGEFMITNMDRAEIHDIFHYEDSDVWFLCKINFESGDSEEGRRSKRVSQLFLVSAHSVKEAYERLHESLGGMLIDFQIPKIQVSPIVDIFPFGDDGEDRVAVEFERQVKREVREAAERAGTRGTGVRYLNEEPLDPLFHESARIVVESQQGSTSLLQRKLKLGYTRASRVIDQLEKKGVIGPFQGSKARAVNFQDFGTLNAFLDGELESVIIDENNRPTAEEEE